MNDNAQWQTVAAIVVVGSAAFWILRRSWTSFKAPAVGGSSACGACSGCGNAGGRLTQAVKSPTCDVPPAGFVPIAELEGNSVDERAFPSATRLES